MCLVLLGFRVFDSSRKLTEVGGRSTEVGGTLKITKNPVATMVSNLKALINQGFAAIFEPTKKWRSFLQNEEKMRKKCPMKRKWREKSGEKKVALQFIWISVVDRTDIYIPLNTASLAALKTAPYFFFSELRQAI